MKTKNTLGKLSMSLVLVFTALSAHKADGVPISSPPSIQWFASSLPREDSTGAAQGASWPSAATNWMMAIRTNSTTAVGTGRAAAMNINYADHFGMVTSSAFNSWRAVAEFPSSEYGNRQYFGFKVVVQSGSFVPSNITYHITTQVWNTSSGWNTVLFNNVSSSMALDNNIFRQRLDAGGDGVFGTSDDSVSSSQVMSLPTKAFVYGGYGIGVGAYGSGSPQDQLNNALNYIQSGKFRVLLTVGVPYSDGNTYTFTTIYMPPATDIQAVYLPPSGSTPAYVSWPGSTGTLYSVESSTDLVSWNPPVYVNGAAGSTFCPVLDQHNGVPKCFYRVKAFP